MAKTVKPPERTFAEMDSRERFVFVGKALVFFATGGFVFPTMWID